MMHFQSGEYSKEVALDQANYLRTLLDLWKAGAIKSVHKPFFHNRAPSLSFSRDRCEHDRLPNIYLRFDHSRDLPLSKSKLTSFWQYVKNSKMDHRYAGERSVVSINPELGEEEENTEVPIAADRETKEFENAQEASADEKKDKIDVSYELRHLYDLFVKNGLDKAALAIDTSYRVKPITCTCGTLCCSCNVYSPYLHKLGVHKYKKILQEEGQQFKRLLDMENRHRRSIVPSSARVSPTIINPFKQDVPNNSVRDVFNEMNIKTYAKLVFDLSKQSDDDLVAIKTKKKRNNFPALLSNDPNKRPRWRI